MRTFIPENAAICPGCGCWLADTDTDDENMELCNSCAWEEGRSVKEPANA